MKTQAYYLTETDQPDDPTRTQVLVMTEHPLSSYGQAVVLDEGEAIPAQNFGHALFLIWEHATGNDEAQDLVARANKLSGHGDVTTTAELKSEFQGFFA